MLLWAQDDAEEEMFGQPPLRWAIAEHHTAQHGKGDASGTVVAIVVGPACLPR